MKRTIDPLIKDLVKELNAAGFATNSSCQGKTCQADFDKGKHCDHSFITFDDEDVLFQRRGEARRLGLFVYNGSHSISAISGRERTVRTVIARNLEFVARMRKLFGLTPPS